MRGHNRIRNGNSKFRKTKTQGTILLTSATSSQKVVQGSQWNSLVRLPLTQREGMEQRRTKIDMALDQHKILTFIIKIRVVNVQHQHLAAFLKSSN